MSKGILEGKTGVVFGVANKRSIAWAIAKAWKEAGANLIFNYQGERVKENVEELVAEFGANVPVYPCDVSKDEEIAAFQKELTVTPTSTCCYTRLLLPRKRRWKTILSPLLARRFPRRWTSVPTLSSRYRARRRR